MSGLIMIIMLIFIGLTTQSLTNIGSSQLTILFMLQLRTQEGGDIPPL